MTNEWALSVFCNRLVWVIVWTNPRTECNSHLLLERGWDIPTQRWAILLPKVTYKIETLCKRCFDWYKLKEMSHTPGLNQENMLRFIEKGELMKRNHVSAGMKKSLSKMMRLLFESLCFNLEDYDDLQGMCLQTTAWALLLSHLLYQSK